METIVLTGDMTPIQRAAIKRKEGRMRRPATKKSADQPQDLGGTTDMTTAKTTNILPALPAPGSFGPRPRTDANGEADMQGALITSILVMYPAVASIAVILAGVVYFGGGFTS